MTLNWQRWTFTDPSGTLPAFTFPINPNTIAPQQLPVNITANASGVGPYSHASGNDVQAPTTPIEWSFNGTVFTLDQLDTFDTWLNLGLPIVLVDHWGLHYQILFTAFDTERAGKRRSTGRHTYTAHALLLQQYTRRVLS